MTHRRQERKRQVSRQSKTYVWHIRALELLSEERVQRLSASAWILAICSLLLPCAGAQARDLVVSNIGARLSPSGLEARFTLDTLADPRVFLLPAPRPRLVIDLPSARIAGPEGMSAQGQQAMTLPGVQLRYARHQADQTRLVFDLPRDAKLGKVSRALDGGGLQYAISLILEPKAAGEAIVVQDEGQVKTVPGTAPRRSTPLIVLDAGHGGHDPGASGAGGEREKDVTLAAAQELSALLQERGFSVRLTRPDDSFVPLDQRVERARAWGADLFLSLHADAAGRASVGGASVYTLSARGGDRTRRLREAKDWVQPSDSPEVSDILFDLTHHASVDRSKTFSAVLQQHLQGTIPLLRNSQRGAEFYVLLAPDVPAVLLEMGFITNAADAMRLSNAKSRAPMLRAVTQAIEEHFAVPTLLAAKD